MEKVMSLRPGQRLSDRTIRRAGAASGHRRLGDVPHPPDPADPAQEGKGPASRNSRKPRRDRLRKATGRSCAAARGKGGDKLEKYSNFLEPQDEKQYSDIKLKLMQAGYRSKDAVRTYHFLQFFLGILFLLAGHHLCDLQLGHGRTFDPVADPVGRHSGCGRLHASQILGHQAASKSARKRSPTASRIRTRHDAGLRRSRPVARPGDRPGVEGNPRRFPGSCRRVRAGRERDEGR